MHYSSSIAAVYQQRERPSLKSDQIVACPVRLAFDTHSTRKQVRSRLKTTDAPFFPNMFNGSTLLQPNTHRLIASRCFAETTTSRCR